MRSSIRQSRRELFWRAVRVSAGSPHREDTRDIGRYVVSRGPAAISEFSRQLDEKVALLRRANVDVALRKSRATLTNGDLVSQLSSAEIDALLQGVLLDGPHELDRLLRNPAEVSEFEDDIFYAVDMRASVDAAMSEADLGRDLWEEAPGDFRRDGSPWLIVNTAFDAVDDGDFDDSPNSPWNDPLFVTGFAKYSLEASLDDSWRAWRDERTIKQMNVWIEWVFGYEKEEDFNVSQSRSVLNVTAFRRGKRLWTELSPRDLAYHEVSSVLARLRHETGE